MANTKSLLQSRRKDAIKDRQHQAERHLHYLTLLSTYVLQSIIYYYIPNESLYFYLSNHINEIMIKFIFLKLWILNQFFNFYFFNINISLNNYTPVMKF